MFEPLLSLMATNELVLFTTVFILSLLVGSFLNVVIYRLPLIMEKEWQSECRLLLEDELTSKAKKYNKNEAVFNLAKPDSHCPRCQTPLKAWQNIPLFSYLFQKCKCAHCNEPISIRYPFVELLTASLSLVVVMTFGYSVQSLVLIPITWCFVALTFIDIDKMLLPDQITLPLLWSVLIASNWQVFLSPMDTIWGAVFGYLSLWSVYWLYKLVTGKEGMGHGDFKLLAVVGAVVGAYKLPMVILMSSVVGLVFALIGIINKSRSKSQPMPFGPYLAIAGWIVMLWGEQLFNWYITQLV